MELINGLDVDNLRSRVLQDTLQQISSATVSRTACCVICLGDITEQCQAQPCKHNNFDYLCLLTWMDQRANCPLCKAEVHEVWHDPGLNGEHTKVYKVSERTKASDNSSAVDRTRDNSGWVARGQPFENEAIRRRRFIYQNNLHSHHVGSNRRQPLDSRHQEFTPELVKIDPAIRSRARTWLRRELQVFVFLNCDGNPEPGNDPDREKRPSRADYLVEYIIAILKMVDIQGSAGQAENMIQDHLGRRNTQLFLHELKAWLRSPCETLDAWDKIVQYGDEDCNQN
ncbi:RING/U-box [Glarea lozoyensis ATCC 20868]|uniref:RING-type E3 ubiquitin transferase n=1 Tax=Glarea lozoyensis (strain ATCC 20868 / MF5171) TaxID=1116229 RepID=S3CQ33_GLAL2|nr:RING/U-box [Glarea lozoyensis ATCC 20868]EPE27790.1 RING/U-box [Glarea lozoyensis ATCC 20868]